MKQIELTQGQVALVDDADYDELSGHKWYANRNPRNGDYYAARKSSTVDGKRHPIYMHREILGLEYGDKRKADHRNHQTLDNYRNNLRICTNQQNSMNRKTKVDSISQFLGVAWHKQSKKWQAQIVVNGKSNHLGLYDDEELAAMAYDMIAREIHGRFAYLNFLPPRRSSSAFI